MATHDVSAIVKLRRQWPLSDPRSRARNGLSLLTAIASFQGGGLDDSEYISTRHHHQFTCGAGHRFSSPAQRVLDGHWCPECAHDERRRGIYDAQAFAHEHGGSCLSISYRRITDLMRWRCALGHRWKATYRQVLDNQQWCPICRTKDHAAATRRTLEQLNEIARGHGGRVLSRAYLSSRVKLPFQCAKGHKWEALPDNVLRKGHWCRHCNSNWRSPEEHLKALRLLVRAQGGRLLSTAYVNRITKVDVQCAKGHVWSVQPAKLQLGRWCPTCHYDRLRTYRDEKLRLAAKARSKGIALIVR